jgi:hypothetical protein
MATERMLASMRQAMHWPSSEPCLRSRGRHDRPPWFLPSVVVLHASLCVPALWIGVACVRSVVQHAMTVSCRESG